MGRIFRRQTAKLFVLCAASLALLNGQAAAVPQWQIDAGGKMAFEVASIKPSPPGAFRPPNFPLDPGDSFTNLQTKEAPGSRFFAVFPLSVYITFAYKIMPAPEQRRAMLASLPKWVSTDSYEIEGRASVAHPTKDQMRLMMQSLLAERFHLEAHFETQTVAAFALLLAKPGKTGPNLRPHDEGPSCTAAPAKGDVLPPICGNFVMILQRNGERRAGYRNGTMDVVASGIPTFGEIDRPVVNRTGLNGKFDFTLEWAHEPGGAPAGPPPPDSQASAAGPSFITALNEQLGLKLEATKAAVPVLVVDHVERPSGN
jgi:bla regulator protein blaR1